MWSFAPPATRGESRPLRIGAAGRSRCRHPVWFAVSRSGADTAQEQNRGDHHHRPRVRWPTDLAAVSRAFAAQLGRASVDVLVGLLADIYGDSAVGDRFAETFLVHERFMVAEVLDRAVARGELKRLPDPTAVQALLFGPVFAWLLILDGDPGRTAEPAETAAVAVAARLRDGTRM
ncbi:TetR-like C-terminal domain-containing protein [Nocardia testacea]|uniref:TetR-like C-terminal domain-containing protein n=1 Tax=Nocardia testacea TaxID=248551 RepID=UPI003A886589